MRAYEQQSVSQNKKKNKNKLTKFTYYKTSDALIKVLFLDDEYYIDQGSYPFTDPSGKKNINIGKLFAFKDIGVVERLIVTEAVYIGHL